MIKIFSGIWVLLLASLIAGCGGSDSKKGGGSALSLIDPSDINLGLASTFAVFGGSAGMTNQGTATVVIGDMGTIGASTMITGFHSSAFTYTETPLNIGVVTGSVYSNAPQGTAASFAIATAVRKDAQAAYDYLASIPGGKDPGDGQLGGLTLEQGLYKSDSGAFLITGKDLTLDAKGDADAVWVFQMKSSLTVGSSSRPSSVLLVNGAQAKNVYWQVGSAATINGVSGGTMVGTIISMAGATFSTAGKTTITKLNGRVLSLVASVTLVNTSINVYNSVAITGGASLLADTFRSNITLSGSHSGDVSPTITGGGSINVMNNGAHVAATQTGAGRININNNGVGCVIAATNTGTGTMTINSTATAAVAVTNTGNGNITVNATGSTPLALTYTDGLDHVYPELTALEQAALIPGHISVTGLNKLDVAPVLTGNGYIFVVNNGAHVAATETGSGTISIVNDGVGCVIAATNTGNGVMKIHSTATAAVNVTNTGNGNVTVYATGNSVTTITHTGDDDVTYGSPSSEVALVLAANITVTGENKLDVAPVLTDAGVGYINVMNNGAHVAATQTQAGTINIVNNGPGCVIAATNTGTGTMNINSTATAAVTVTNTGNGNITVWATGSDAITLTYSDGLDHTFGIPESSSALIAYHISVTGYNRLDVAPVLTGSGYINVVNNGAHVAATQTGSGSISIVNNGQVMAATNTGSGKMTINSTCTGAVAVTNNGNGNVTVNATGTSVIALTYNDDNDHVYPDPSGELTALVAGSAPASYTISTITGGGFINVVNNVLFYVTSTVTGIGTINVMNDGEGVTATLTGSGLMNIDNNGKGLTVTNTGNGVVTVKNSCTAFVTVTNTGNGNVIVDAMGSDPITLTHTGDDDFIYGAMSALLMGPASQNNLSGSNVVGIIETNDIGWLNIVNNGAGVTATQTGAGTINIVNSGTAALTTTNTGTGTVTVNNTGSGAITVTNTDLVNLIVNNKASGPVTVTIPAHTGNPTIKVTAYGNGGTYTYAGTGNADVVLH